MAIDRLHVTSLLPCWGTIRKDSSTAPPTWPPRLCHSNLSGLIASHLSIRQKDRHLCTHRHNARAHTSLLTSRFKNAISSSCEKKETNFHRTKSQYTTHTHTHTHTHRLTSTHGNRLSSRDTLQHTDQYLYFSVSSFKLLRKRKGGGLLAYHLLKNNIEKSK